ncbi:MAG: hypothetical protein ABW123_16070, partial [Cystobacter sp.]
MSKRITTAVAILGVTGVFSGCNFEQPSAGCQVQDATDAPWQAAYFLTNPERDSGKTCNVLKGEALGAFKYINPETGHTYMALRPTGAASLIEVDDYTDPENPGSIRRVEDPTLATSLSQTLDAEPNATGLCGATGFAPISITVATPITYTDIAGQPQSSPAQTVAYAFDNVQVYSAPSAPGTQLQATVKYSDGAGCEVEYRMLALWPQVPCSVEAFNNPTENNAANRCAEGSGLNPDFDAVCIANIGPAAYEEDEDGNVTAIIPQGGCVPNPA